MPSAGCSGAWPSKQRRNPLLVLRVPSAFELCVGECAAQQDRPPLLEELARIRVRLGFDRLPQDQPVHTTRQLAQGQTLSLWPPDADPAQRACWVSSPPPSGAGWRSWA